ncbi:ninein-like protein isoform X3 [Epinephelus lanceolatus]
MEETEHSQYVAQLKVEFDSCDTTATGFLDRDELTVLCRKLQLDAHLPLLLHMLLGERTYARVNFEEFKEGFVAVLSRSLDFSTSEDDSSYLEPVVPEEVKPKFVKGTKRYGRRSRPDSQPGAALTCDSEESLPSRTEATDSSPPGVRRAKLRRSTSLESVESLKSDEETGSQKNIQQDFQSKAAKQEAELGEGGVGGGGVLTAVCDHLGLQQCNTQEVDALIRKLDTDLDGRVSIRDFQKVLCVSAPVCSSTPVRSADLQRVPQRSQEVLEEHSARSTSPSLLTATVGQRVLSRLDEGSGCTSPERVIALWTEEGIRNSLDILQTLDFPLEERISLADLTLALDNELLVSGNGIHQAALISYKNEIQHLQAVLEQACRERDKVKADLDQADHRNLQLVREVDDRHASMETLNQTRIRDLEQDFRDRLAALRSQSEQESEALMQHVETERSTLQDELQLLQAQEAELQEELRSATQENSRLEEDLRVMKLKLTEAESSVNRLQRDLDQLLHDKFGGLDAASAGLSQEERFSEIVKEYELQCRELRDRNDELSSELELLKSQRSDRKSRRSAGDDTSTALSWTDQQAVSAESDSDESDMKSSSSPAVRKKLQPADKTALSSLGGVSGPAVSIQTELALEQLKQNHNEELQQLHIQLDTQVNYYERRLEVMRQSMEVERKDISQAFKLEISEVEEQKAQVEQQVKQLKETVDKLHAQIQHGGGGGGWSHEQERRMQRERAELEQNFAREIGNLVQRLSAEKEQLEAELKLKMDQEVMLVRDEAEQQLSHMKLQYSEGQRRLLHQLHRERQRLQEQRGCWEKRLAQVEQEKLRSEERATEERRKVEEQQKEVSKLQEVVQSSHLQISQSEASMEELRRRCGQLEEDLKACSGRCSELEARLEEACSQLEASVSVLESQEVLNKHLSSERCCVEAELQEVKHREEQLLLQLENLRAASDSILQDREVVADNCSRLSNAFIQQQAQLRVREETVDGLRAELEALQEVTRSTAAELDSLKTDRSRLIQDLKEQAMAVDTLQLELDGVSEEVERRRSSEEALQEALKEEQSRSSQLCSGLDEEKEEVRRLSQENASYARLADQLSTQIVEMEEEISTLRDHLKELSSQLNDTADLVLVLRTQLNAKTSETDHLRVQGPDGVKILLRQTETNQLDLRDQLRTEDLKGQQVLQLQRDLQDSQDQLRRAEEDFEQEKMKMKQQLMELETLVLALEDTMDLSRLHRTQLQEVRSENTALQERLSVLQQEVHGLEDDIANKRRKLEDLEREHERSREEEECLHRENSRYREEVLDLSSRNLQLSNDNAELSARLRGDQESVRMLRERLATVSKEQEEEGALVRRLQDAALQQDREKLQQQAAWTQERQLLETELSSYRDKLGRHAELEAELSSVTLKLQWVEEDKSKLLREADDRNNKVEKLQQAALSVEAESELLRSQLHAVTQEKLNHAQEVTDLQRKLRDALNKVEQLESSVKKLMREREELHQAVKEQEEQEEARRLRVHNQELQQQVLELTVRSLEVQNLKSRLKEAETERMHAQDQEQYEKAVSALQQRMEELETKLKGLRMVLQDKVQQLKEQMAKNTKSSALLKDLYVENSQLMTALQVTEQRQKHVEKKNSLLEEKVNALNKLLREIVPAALAT